MRRCGISVFFFAAFCLPFFLGACSKAAEKPEGSGSTAIDRPAVEELMGRLEAASKAKDYAAMRDCYAGDAIIEIDTKNHNRRFSLGDYLALTAKNAAKVRDYTYDAQDTKITLEDNGARVSQTVTETARTDGTLFRSKAEAAYTIRLVDGKPRITRVAAKLIVAAPTAPEGLVIPDES